MSDKESYTAKIIKKYCDQKRISVKELAPMVDMSYTGLHSSIKKNTLKGETLYKIAQVFNVSVSDFFEEDYQRLSSDPKRVENIQKIQSEVESKRETIEFLKDKVNDLYNLYWSFQLSLNEEDTARLYKNDKLHKFEMGFIFTIQEILSMIAETKEERERLHSLIEVASEKVVAVSSNDTSAMKRILVKRENLLKAITGPDLTPAWSFSKKTDEGKDHNETTEEKNTAGQKKG